MNLKQHPQRQALVLNALVQADHGGLDQIGGGTLHDRVDRQALGLGPDGGVARLDVWNRAAAAMDRADEAVAAGVAYAALDEAANARVAGKIGLDERLSFVAAHAG